MACVEAGWSAYAVVGSWVRILTVRLPFPLAFHLELKGMRESSPRRSWVVEEGTRGSVMALARHEDGLWIDLEEVSHIFGHILYAG